MHELLLLHYSQPTTSHLVLISSPCWQPCMSCWSVYSGYGFSIHDGYLSYVWRWLRLFSSLTLPPIQADASLKVFCDSKGYDGFMDCVDLWRFRANIIHINLQRSIHDKIRNRHQTTLLQLYSDLYMVKLVRHILNDLYAVIKTFKNREILQWLEKNRSRPSGKILRWWR